MKEKVCIKCGLPITQKYFVMLQVMEVKKVRRFRSENLIEKATPVKGAFSYQHTTCMEAR